MFVSANRINFTPKGISNLSINDEVKIESGMGGCYSLSVASVSDEGITLQGKKSVPSWIRNPSYSWDEAISELYLLMPSAEFGVFQKHIDLAKKAGYLTNDEVISIVSDTANTPKFTVEEFLAKYI